MDAAEDGTLGADEGPGTSVKLVFDPRPKKKELA